MLLLACGAQTNTQQTSFRLFHNVSAKTKSVLSRPPSRMDHHLRYLDECAELNEGRGKNIGKAGTPSDPLERLGILNPDMMLEVAKVGPFS